MRILHFRAARFAMKITEQPSIPRQLIARPIRRLIAGQIVRLVHISCEEGIVLRGLIDTSFVLVHGAVGFGVGKGAIEPFAGFFGQTALAGSVSM